jgi:hypothetical protein
VRVDLPVHAPDPESDKRFREALHQLDRLPRSERDEAMSAFLSCTASALDLAQMRALRAELAKEFGAAWEFIPLLDGDIASREARERGGDARIGERPEHGG